MKKIKILIIMMILSLSLIGCKKDGSKVKPKLELNETEITLKEGETYTIEPIVTDCETEVNFAVEADNNQVVTINDLTITAVSIGTTNVKIWIKNNEDIQATLKVNVVENPKPVLTIKEDIVDVLIIDDSYTIVPELKNFEGTPKYIIEVEEEIATVEGMNLKIIYAGTTKVKVSLEGYPEVYDEFTLVIHPRPTFEEIPDEIWEIHLQIGESYEYDLKIKNEYIYDIKIEYGTLAQDIIQFEGNKVTALAEGVAEAYAKLYVNGTNYVTTMLYVYVHAEDNEAPIFEGEEVVKLNWGKEFDPLQDLKVIDNIDGDITKQVKVTHEIDNKTYGTYEVKYEVSDKAGNVATFTRKVEVVWNYEVQFIGHQGSYYGVPNSEESFLYGAKVLHYQALECDVKQTKDGVFVTCHDDTFGGVKIADTTYEELSKIVVNSSRTAGYPSQYGEMPGTGKYSSNICTLERYLEICKEYGCYAVIELKGSPGISNTDQSKMPALMKLIEKMDMLEQTIFLASAYNCLIWVKQNGYEYIPCQYLVDSFASETVFNRCKTYGLDVSGCVTYGNGEKENTAEWVARYQEAGIKVSTYTFTQYSDYSDVQKWIDIGVDFVTVDWHSMHKLTLPDSGEVVKHTVKFYDYDGRLIKETLVKDGKAAAIPQNPSREGYEFIGWDQSVKKVTSDLEVTAQYEAIEYTITYDDNLYITSKSSWANKEEFVQEFYNDLFEWAKASVGKVSTISYKDGVYTIKTNSTDYGTCTFSSVQDILALDIYYFERTFGPLIYKPISGTNSADYVPVIDSTYFLNAEPYRSKYIEMNAYFLKAMQTSYTGYSYTYQQASNNRVQIMFRFHQWAKGYNNAAFNTLPNKYVFKYASNIEATMPTDHIKYTVEDAFELSKPIASIQFLGWYLDRDATGEAVTSIEKGTTGDIILYAKWEEFTIPDVYSKINYELDGGENNLENKEQYLEGVSTVLYPATKEGYVFLGWTLEKEGSNYIASISEKVSGEITLYAHYDFAKYSVVYDLQEGSWGNKIEFTGSAITSITATANSGFWTGYASNIYLYNSTKFTGDLNAVWSFRVGIAMDELVGTYVVKKITDSGGTFDATGCDYIVVISSSYGSYNSTSSFRKAVAVGQVVKFVGDPDTGSATVEFYNAEDVSGNKIENFVSEYTINDLPLLLPTPKLEGKTFKGWGLAKDATEVITSLEKGMTGDLTLYAIWE